MKKVGIISLYGNRNYGNKLQSYAVQEFFRSLGFETIVIKNCDIYSDTRELPLLKHYVEECKNLVKHFFVLPQRTRVLPGTRQEMFKSFSDKYITETEVYIDKYNYKRKMPDCDYYVVGSDQVWNYHFAPLNNPLYYLEFAPEEKRLSIAASFGFSDYETKYEEVLKKKLSGFRLITVRENSAKTMVENLCNKKAEVILDPTLLINWKEWKKIEKAPDIEDGEFILTYFLGKISDKRKEELKRFADSIGCRIIALNDSEHPEYENIGPREFLYLIHNAKYVMTDSFHACAFSIIFERDFYVLKREGASDDMSDRITTLLKRFRLTERYVDERDLRYTEIDYTDASDILLNERNRVAAMFMNEMQDN